MSPSQSLRALLLDEAAWLPDDEEDAEGLPGTREPQQVRTLGEGGRAASMESLASMSSVGRRSSRAASLRGSEATPRLQVDETARSTLNDGRSSTGAMEHVELDQALDAIINSGFKVL